MASDAGESAEPVAVSVAHQACFRATPIVAMACRVFATAAYRSRTDISSVDVRASVANFLNDPYYELAIIEFCRTLGSKGTRKQVLDGALAAIGEVAGTRPDERGVIDGGQVLHPAIILPDEPLIPILIINA